jgi:hypothetical protein
MRLGFTPLHQQDMVMISMEKLQAFAYDELFMSILRQALRIKRREGFVAIFYVIVSQEMKSKLQVCEKTVQCFLSCFIRLEIEINLNWLYFC